MKNPTLKARLRLILVLALAPAIALATISACKEFAQASSIARMGSASSIDAALSGLRVGLGVELAMILLSSLVVLGVLWGVAERWCLRPLKSIEAAAAAIAQGDLAPPWPDRPTVPELEALTHSIFALGAAISARERALRASLAQREHMLREIHHRVKNNLQMISSLLNLQADKIRSPRILRLFDDTRNRMQVLSILHQHLYERSDWSTIDFQAYISDLVEHVSARRSTMDRPAVRYSVQAGVMPVGPDVAIPVGLIVNEAVSNALSHAFADTVAPEIRIVAEDSEGEIVIMIDDNGRGSSLAGAQTDGRRGLGITLINGLAAQLGGSAEISSGPTGGTRVRVRFPSPLPAASGGPPAMIGGL